MNFGLNKKLCTLSVICSLAFSPVFAEENYTPEVLEGFVQQSRMHDLSPEYIDNVRNLLEKQMREKDFKTAENTADYYVDITKKYYGRHSKKLAEAYITRSRLYRNYIIPKKAFNDLESAEALKKWNSKNNDMRFSLESDYAELYSKIGQPYDAISVLEKVSEKKFPDPNMQAGKTHRIAGLYAQAGDDIKSEEYFKKAIDIYNSQEHKNYYGLMGAYSALADLATPSEALKDLQEQLKIANSLPQRDIGAKINAKLNLLGYYNRMDRIAEQKKLLDETAELIKSHPDRDWEIEINRLYISYYRTQGNTKMIQKHSDILKKYRHEFDWSSVPKESLMLTRKYHDDIFSNMDNPTEAKKYLNLAIEQLEPIKKYVPVKYADFLSKGAMISMAENNYAEALDYLKKAEKILTKQKHEPTYQLAHLYDLYSDVYRQQNDYENAMKYLDMANSKYSLIQKEYSGDILGNYMRKADIYISSGNKEEAEKYINKFVDTAKKIYGENHVKTCEAMYNAYFSLQRTDKEKSDAMFKQMTDVLNSGKVVGVSPWLFYNVNVMQARNEVVKDNHKQVVVYAEKALKYALNNNQKEEVYDILADSYNRIPGKREASLTYKKLSNAIKQKNSK